MITAAVAMRSLREPMDRDEASLETYDELHIEVSPLVREIHEPFQADRPLNDYSPEFLEQFE
jgi:hypothetical protein